MTLAKIEAVIGVLTRANEMAAASMESAMTAMEQAVEAGRLLNEAKAMVPHGEWEQYANTHYKHGRSHRCRMMRLAEHAGELERSGFDFATSSFARAEEAIARLEGGETATVADLPAWTTELPPIPPAIPQQSEETPEKTPISGEMIPPPIPPAWHVMRDNHTNAVRHCDNLSHAIQRLLEAGAVPVEMLRSAANNVTALRSAIKFSAPAQCLAEGAHDAACACRGRGWVAEMDARHAPKPRIA